MFLIVDVTNNVVTRGVWEQVPLKINEILVELQEGEYQHDMMGSIFLAVDDYKPRPSNEPYIVAQGNEWVDVRNTATKWEDLRTRRNAELAASDWTQLPDAPLSTDEITAARVWRATVRDIPQQESTPEDAEATLDTLLDSKPF